MTPRTRTSSAQRAMSSTGSATDETTKRRTRSSSPARPRVKSALSAKDPETVPADDTTPPSPAKATAPPPPAPGVKPWEVENNETRTAISVRLPESLKTRQDGLIDWLNTHDEGEIPSWLQPVHSATELSCYALHLLLERAENELNKGKALPQVIRRRR